MHKTLIYILLLILLPTLIFAQSLTCVRCLKPLSNKYWKVKDLSYCDECYEEMRIKCGICGKNISDRYLNRNGINYCPECMKKSFAIKCSECSSCIEGKYYKQEWKNICQQCYLKYYAKRCSFCNIIINGRYYKKNRLLYCTLCFEKRALPVCTVCGVKMRGKYISAIGRNKCFCKLCNKKYPHCKCCSVPVKKPSNKSDLVFCADCSKNIISSKYDLNKLFARVTDSSYRVSGLRVQVNKKNIMLASKAYLESVMGKTKGSRHSEKELLGVCRPEYIFGRLFRQSIFIQRDLPYEMAFDALSHEYGHAFLNVAVRQKLPPRKEEGFCEWVAYRNLIEAGFIARAKVKVANTDPIYGKGLREMLALEKKLGSPSKLVEYIRKQR